MEATLCEINGKPRKIAVKDGAVYLDGEAIPVKNIGEEDVRQYAEALKALPENDPEGRAVLKSALSAEFLVKLIGNAVGDDCVNRLTRLLDHVHYDVLKYLGDAGEEG